MAIHDDYLRRTPYERALPDADFADRHFAEIRDEAARRGVALSDPGAFAVLESAAAALDELRRADEDPDTLPRHAAVLFHAFHHEAAGRPVLLVETPALRHLIEGTAATPSSAEGLKASSYVQLPQHLVWLASDGAPLSVDGFFWTVPEDGTVHLLAVAGLIGDRPGFVAVVVPGAPLADRATWVDERMRSDGTPDFGTELPGAELDRLYEVRTAGELLKLGARLDRLLRSQGVEVRPGPAAPVRSGAPGPTSSDLDYAVLALR